MIDYKKKIYIYDLNMPSLLAYYRDEIEEMGINIIHIDKLSWIDDDNYPLIINPLSCVSTKHWEEIKTYIPNNTNRNIILVAPDYNKNELDDIVGIHSHLKTFCNSFDGQNFLNEINKNYERL